MGEARQAGTGTAECEERSGRGMGMSLNLAGSELALAWGGWTVRLGPQSLLFLGMTLLN